MRSHAVETRVYRLHRRAVPTHQPVLAQQPHITQHGDRVVGGSRRIVWICQALGNRGQQRLQFLLAEPDQRQIEVLLLQRLQLLAQQISIPAGIDRNLIVGDDQCPLLRRCQAVHHDGR